MGEFSRVRSSFYPLPMAFMIVLKISWSINTLNTIRQIPLIFYTKSYKTEGRSLRGKIFNQPCIKRNSYVDINRIKLKCGIFIISPDISIFPFGRPDRVSSIANHISLFVQTTSNGSNAILFSIGYRCNYREHHWSMFC